MAKLTKKEQQQYDICLGQCSQCLVGHPCQLQIKIRELRVLSTEEKLDIALMFLGVAKKLDEYAAECERREKDGG